MSSDKYDNVDADIDAVAKHEERMELFYARCEDVAPNGVDPEILKEITSPDYKGEDE